MPKILLLEDVHQFTPKADSLRTVMEGISRGTLKFPVEIPGRLSVIGVRNENNRRYRKPVWEKQLQENSQLRQLIKARRSVGLLEHPADGTVSLNSPISHVLTDVWMENVNGQDEIFGKLGFINTPEGNKMLSLIESGYNPLVSSRGYGSVVKADDGVDEVQEDYICEGWDVVWNPSFKTAELDGSKIRIGSAEESKKKPAITSESPEANLYESKTEQTNITMNDQLKAIRESLAPIATADVAKLSPSRIADTLSRCGELHRRAAQVTEPTLSWDVHEIHKEISDQENRLQEAMGEPQKKIAVLNEQSVKTLKTLKVIAETALKYKSAATKYLRVSESKAAKLRETIERGQGWVKRARLAEARLEKLDAKYQFACEAVDEIEARYKTDTTELGRRVLSLEFKDKFAANADLTKQLNEAATLRDLIKIREFVSPKPGPGEDTGKEKPTKAPVHSPGEDETLSDAKDVKDEEEKGVEKDGAPKGGSNKGNVGPRGQAEAVMGKKPVKEEVDLGPGPGEVVGKSKPTSEPTDNPDEDENLADPADAKSEELKKLTKDGASGGKGKTRETGEEDDGAKVTAGKNSVGPKPAENESSLGGVRTTELTEAVLMSPDRSFSVGELGASIRRLSESRK